MSPFPDRSCCTCPCLDCCRCGLPCLVSCSQLLPGFQSQVSCTSQTGRHHSDHRSCWNLGCTRTGCLELKAWVDSKTRCQLRRCTGSYHPAMSCHHSHFQHHHSCTRQTLCLGCSQSSWGCSGSVGSASSFLQLSCLQPRGPQSWCWHTGCTVQW